jgi:DNA-binding IclR family transcriptional regulator
LGSPREWRDILNSIVGATLGGQKRRLGRFLFACKADKYREQVQTQVKLVQHNGITEVTFHVLVGLAGGTGSGSVVDAVAQLRDLYPDSKRYRAALKLASLGAGVISNFDLRNYVHPQLVKLHQETKHTCNLGIREGDLGIYADKIESHDYGIKLFSEIGKTFPLYCTALGKVLVAYGPAELRKRILAQPMKPFTPKTVTLPRELTRQLTRVHEQGYAVDREEITRGIVCIAAPVFGPHRDIVGALSVTFPAYLAEERGIDTDIAAVCRHAAAVSGSAGTGPAPLE